MGMGSQNTTPGQPNDYSWVNDLLAQVARQSPVSQLSSLPPGLRASGINATTGPEVLYASGMFDPSRLEGLINDKYAKLLADHQTSLADVYGDLPLPPAESYSYQNSTYLAGRPEISEIFSAAIVPGIQSGQLSTEAEVANYLTELAKGNFPPEVKNAIIAEQDTIGDLIARTRNEYEKYLGDVQAYNTKYGAQKLVADQKAAALGVALPTKQDAWSEVANDLGAPQLASLPSPTEKFELPLSQFTDAERLADLAGQSRAAVSRLQSPRMAAMSRRLAEQDAMAQRWQGRANQELARQYAMDQTKDYATGPKAGDIAKGAALFGVGSLLSPLTFGLSGIAGAIGGVKSVADAGKRERGQKQEAMARFADEKFRELQAGPSGRVIPSMPARPRTAAQQKEDAILTALGFDVSKPSAEQLRLIRGNKEARQLRRDQVRAQRFARAAVQRALKEQSKAQDFLSQAGITPYTQSAAQLLLNAAMQAK